MSLHPQVLFVGDRANPKTNASLDVPFVGTKSYRTLLEWFYRMDIDFTKVYLVNAYTPSGRAIRLPYDDIRARGIRVVALGDAAREALKDKDIKFFSLPHPSGLNRDLNDKKKLSESLAKCRDFIYRSE